MNSASGDRDARLAPAPQLVTAVMRSLYAHPHANTPQALVATIGDARITATEITDALQALRSGKLVHTDGRHWQLSAVGYRKHREAANDQRRVVG